MSRNNKRKSVWVSFFFGDEFFVQRYHFFHLKKELSYVVTLKWNLTLPRTDSLVSGNLTGRVQQHCVNAFWGKVSFIFANVLFPGINFSPPDRRILSITVWITIHKELEEHSGCRKTYSLLVEDVTRVP